MSLANLSNLERLDISNSDMWGESSDIAFGWRPGCACVVVCRTSHLVRSWVFLSQAVILHGEPM